MHRIRASGEATDETSYYPALSNLLNAAGADLTPRVHCVMTPRNRGAGIPDGGLYLRPDVVLRDGGSVVRAPERGVVEAKGLSHPLPPISNSTQVHRYLERYGKVLVTTYRAFQAVHLDSAGRVALGESFQLAASEEEFWNLDPGSGEIDSQAAHFDEFLHRALRADAALSDPEDLAWFLAAYARTARQRLQDAENLPALATLRATLEDALGVRFEGKQGKEFFQATLIQTLFYGLFAAWVVWCDKHPEPTEERFSWRAAHWTLNVPMVRTLFHELAEPRRLPAGIDEVLDWSEEVLARVERVPFFESFESRQAIQFFYEPFLRAYDPDLRRQLGVWYTPPEVVRYIVARVHEALRRDLNLALGLADPRVHVLDPCTGTGSFLVEVLQTIAAELENVHGDALVGEQVKEAAMQRIHGFELLPAPFVVAHLQLGLTLQGLDAPLDEGEHERVSVYLTNALTGWFDSEESLLPIEEFGAERAAAGNVKRVEPILVVLGNPPYNGYAGVASQDEVDLMRPYKEGLSDKPWEITKNKLDDYYIRFFRVAERRIAETTQRGIICFISNFGWLGDPSAVVMRKRLTTEFDRIYIDNLNGDSRETGKKTPSGEPDPSVFSTNGGPSGIQVGTAVSLLVRTEDHSDAGADCLYRDFWGGAKREELLASLDAAPGERDYETLDPDEENWYRLRPWNPRPGYEHWPQVSDLAAVDPALGMNENRGESLISMDREVLIRRMRHFLDPSLDLTDLEPEIVGGLLESWADYDASSTRRRLLHESPFSEERVRPVQVRPFDLRWAYVDATPKLWNRPRPEYIASARLGSEFLLVRRRAPRALDGAAFLLTPELIDQHALHRHAYTIPLLLPVREPESSEGRLFEVHEKWRTATPWRPNLSALAIEYLIDLGFRDVADSRETARLIWLHVLAIGYSPQYLAENNDAIRNGSPRVPLPQRREDLESSALLGGQLAALLDVDTPLPGLDTSEVERLRPVGVVTTTESARGSGPDLGVRAGWGREQVRRQQSGAVSRAVMPADGRFVFRERNEAELAAVDARAIETLGEEVVDIYLNNDTYWSGVPEAAWNFKIGGFQVLRKWLSYREETIIGRPLALGEARQFTSIARRLAELARMAPSLDANYVVATGSVAQDALPEFTLPQA